jgi:hypothetical protein
MKGFTCGVDDTATTSDSHGGKVFSCRRQNANNRFWTAPRAVLVFQIKGATGWVSISKRKNGSASGLARPPGHAVAPSFVTRRRHFILSTLVHETPYYIKMGNGRLDGATHFALRNHHTVAFGLFSDSFRPLEVRFLPRTDPMEIHIPSPWCIHVALAPLLLSITP